MTKRFSGKSRTDDKGQLGDEQATFFHSNNVGSPAQSPPTVETKKQPTRKRASKVGPAGDPNSPDGHRNRLRERFREGGADALPDYELLELVLFRALPRRDTKGLSKQLLANFDTFSGVINAPEGG